MSPDRRLHVTRGQARSLFTELMRNMSTRSKPDGAALPNVVERFVSVALSEARETGEAPEQVMRGRPEQLSELVGGYDSTGSGH